LFEAYTYLPLACASVAMAAAASRFKPIYAWVALALWMPHNVRAIRHERRTVLEDDDAAFAFVDALAKWTALHPDATTLIYQGQPPGFNFWGPSGAWNIIHHRKDLVAFPSDWPQAAKAMSSGTVAYGTWNQERNQLTIELRASNGTTSETRGR
jgi:hypothetical protein